MSDASYPDPGLAPWPGFALAADAAVQHLEERFPLDLWLVTAVKDDEQVVVSSAGAWAELAAPGTGFPWKRSFCLQMTERRGPTVACDVRDVPAYAAVATGLLAQVRAYVGVPLLGDDGTVFGTLCAFDGEPQPQDLSDALPLVRLVGQMLSTVLARERFALERSEEAAAARALAGEDPLTGLRNRRSWDLALSREQSRSARYGSTPSVVSLLLDDVDADALVRCARVLEDAARPGDVLARLGGGEFGVLAVECDLVAAQALAARLRVPLRTAGVSAAVGVATRRTGEDLTDAHARATEAAERDRRRRRRASG